MTGQSIHRATISFETVKREASSRWPDVLTYLGIPSDALSGKHAPCPGCGGRDRFRWDAGEEAFFCGQGGATTGGDGFALLNHCGWSKADALHAVAQFFNVERVMLSPEQRVEIQRRKRVAKQAKYEAVLSHELHVLLQVINPRIDGRINADNKNFRDANPQFQQPPDEHWDREVQAAKRIRSLIGKLYGGVA